MRHNRGIPSSHKTANGTERDIKLVELAGEVGMGRIGLDEVTPYHTAWTIRHGTGCPRLVRSGPPPSCPPTQT